MLQAMLMCVCGMSVGTCGWMRLAECVCVQQNFAYEQRLMVQDRHSNCCQPEDVDIAPGCWLGMES